MYIIGNFYKKYFITTIDHQTSTRKVLLPNSNVKILPQNYAGEKKVSKFIATMFTFLLWRSIDVTWLIICLKGTVYNRIEGNNKISIGMKIIVKIYN